MLYKKAEAEIILLSNSDVIATSGGDCSNGAIYAGCTDEASIYMSNAYASGGGMPDLCPGSWGGSGNIPQYG